MSINKLITEFKRSCSWILLHLDRTMLAVLLSFQSSSKAKLTRRWLHYMDLRGINLLV